MASIEDRVLKLENTFAQLRGAAIVLTLFVIGALGYTGWIQVPNEVAKKFTDPTSEIQTHIAAINRSNNNAKEIVSQVEKEAETFTKSLSVLLEQARGTNSEMVELLSESDRQAKHALTQLERGKLSPNVYVLGEIICGKEQEFDVPIPGTKTGDWLVLGANWNFSSATSKPKYTGDNALFSIETSIVPRQDNTGWTASLDVRVNGATTNKSSSIATCENDAHPDDYRTRLGRVQVVAIRAYAGIRASNQ